MHLYSLYPFAPIVTSDLQPNSYFSFCYEFLDQILVVVGSIKLILTLTNKLGQPERGI